MKILKPQISGLEINAVVQEISKLKGGKINQIYLSEEEEFFIQCYARTTGKLIVRIKPGKFIYTSTQKPVMKSPSGLCMQLRKHLINARIEDIKQLHGQRIVQISCSTKEGCINLIIELFGKGNVILANKNSIIGTLHRQKTTEREVKPGVPYQEPDARFDIFSSTKKAMIAVLESSTKDAVKACATDLSLGGTAAEEVCARASVDKKKNASKITAAERSALVNAVKQLIDESAGYVYDKEITPFKLSDKGYATKAATFSEVCNTTLTQSKEAIERMKREVQFQQKIQSVQHILDQQVQKVISAEEKATEHTTKADWIYEHYHEIEKLLQAIHTEREKNGWDGVKKFLKSLKKIEQIDLKDKKIVVKVSK
jgi:predicted ribosome quality control (RQC) complex YloA/Tae2 family protein